jgi:hypothetical protein
MNIEELTFAEERLMANVDRVEGQIQEKIRSLEKQGIFRNYTQVHAIYTQLAIEGNLEALKRALFLQWYASIEPAFLTGIPDGSPLGTAKTIDEDTQLVILKELERRLVVGNLDDKLKWMIAYAYSLVDYYFEYYFEQHPGLFALRQHVSKINNNVEECIDMNATEEMKGRGQMGNYFISIINAIESRTEG